MKFRVEDHAVITPSGKLFHRCRTKDIAKRECDLLNAEIKPLVEALELIKRDLTAEGRYSGSDLEVIIEDALAKAKE